MSQIVLDSHISYPRVMYAYNRAQKEQERHNMAFYDIAMRAARERDPRVLMVLEKAANAITAEDDRQRGVTRSHSDTPFNQQRYTTDTQMFQKAYESMDNGVVEPALGWIYAAGAFLAGYQP